MAKCLQIVIFALNVAVFACAEEVLSLKSTDSEDESSVEEVARGEVQSCRGCSLNRLPDVKTFIYGDLPKYGSVEFHPIPGAVPHLVLFDKSDKELLRVDLSPLSRDECNKLVQKWFKLKEESNSSSKEESREEL